MCTVTWARQKDGYHLLCNRDERNSRQPALGPHCHEKNGVKYIAPIDGDHGGSWIGVNEFGLSLCLLNRYGDVDLHPDRKYISRGLLLIDLFDCFDVWQVKSCINEVNLSRFRPFNLVVLSQTEESTLLEWTGSRYSFIDNVDGHVPLTSTSLTEPGIAIERQRQFATLTAGSGRNEVALDTFHRSHLPERGSHSVCMHRNEAATVSLSKITVANGAILFEYESGPPCEHNDVTTVRLTTRTS
jgi:hypothetical protein